MAYMVHTMAYMVHTMAYMVHTMAYMVHTMAYMVHIMYYGLQGIKTTAYWGMNRWSPIILMYTNVNYSMQGPWNLVY